MGRDVGLKCGGEEDAWACGARGDANTIRIQAYICLLLKISYNSGRVFSCRIEPVGLSSTFDHFGRCPRGRACAAKKNRTRDIAGL